MRVSHFPTQLEHHEDDDPNLEMLPLQYLLGKLVDVLHPFILVLGLRGPIPMVIWQSVPHEADDVLVPALLWPRLGTATWTA